MRNAIEFDCGVFSAFENDINLGVFLMVMLPCIPVNLREMDSSRKLGLFGKRTASNAAGAIDAREGVQIDDSGLS